MIMSYINIVICTYHKFILNADITSFELRLNTVKITKAKASPHIPDIHS